MILIRFTLDNFEGAAVQDEGVLADTLPPRASRPAEPRLRRALAADTWGRR